MSGTSQLNLLHHFGLFLELGLRLHVVECAFDNIGFINSSSPSKNSMCFAIVAYST